MVARDTLAYLTGTGALRRSVSDHRAGVTGSFAGEAEVRADGRRARYEEHGRLRLGDHEGEARRALDLVAGDGDSSVVAVRFTDGRAFFDLDLASGRCDAVHDCGADRYEFWYEVDGRDRLLERWRVTGPAKDYAAQTRWQGC